MGDDQGSSPLARRVPGAARAAPGASERPALPEALLQRMQAVVRAAHAQAAEDQRLANEEEAQRKRTRPDGAVRKSSQSLPRRTRATSNGRKSPLGTALPTSSPPDWSNADDDTSPLPRLNGAIASPAAASIGAEQERAAERARQRAAERDRQLAADGERERASEQERARQERERAAQLERERAAELKRQRAAQLERERAAELERERAAELEQERAAERERHRAAARERERTELAAQRRVAAAVRAPADLLEHPRPSGQEAPGRRR